MIPVSVEHELLEPAHDWITLLIGGGLASPFIVRLGKWMWRQISSERVDTVKDVAEAGIYARLKSEIEDLRTEIRELKAEHAMERESFERKICDLGDKIELMRRARMETRKLAIECYALFLANCPECNERENIKSILMKIARDEPNKLEGME